MDVSFALWCVNDDATPVTCVGNHGRKSTRNQVSIALFSVEASTLPISLYPSIDARHMQWTFMNMKVDKIRVEE